MMLEQRDKTPGRVEAIELIDAHLEEHPDCQCVKALQLAIAKEIVNDDAEGRRPVVVG